jgi:hypothetical protein
MSDTPVTPARPLPPSLPGQSQPESNGSGELRFRVIIVAFLLLSVFLLWWSFIRVLTPRMKESRNLTTAVARLSSQVDDLDRQWAPADIETVTNQYALVPSHLFSDQMALDLWLAGLKDQVNSLALTVKADFGKTTTQVEGEEKFGIISASNSVDIGNAPLDGQMASPYQRLLRLIQTISTQEKRADLMELTVAGGTNSIYHATLGYNFWTAGEVTP